MQLNYREFGQGDPVIILHGMFGMLDNWISVGKQLAEDYSVYLVDLRNHGKSPRHPEMNYHVMAEDLRHFMESHWIHKAHIAGHSMGGKAAMQFAVEYPDMVDKLVIVDIGPGENRSRHDLIFQALFTVDPQKVKTRKEAASILSQMVGDFGVIQFLLKNLKRNKEGGYHWKMNLEVLYENFDKILAPVSAEYPFEGPSLFLRGENSDYILPEEIPEIKALFPSSRVLTIKNAGHWVHADAPAALLKEVRQFLGA